MKMEYDYNVSVPKIIINLCIHTERIKYNAKMCIEFAFSCLLNSQCIYKNIKK